MAKKIENLKNEVGYIKPREITEEMKESYIDYAMSVIISRALPDVRDGLKPVHRRILYTMLEDGLRHDAKFRKSATVVGSCLGRYHPHGDVAVYDSLARMAQDFSLRYPLVKGQGNFGCFTKDTKVRLTDGRNLSFEELIKEQKERKRHWTFTFNPQIGKIEIVEIKNPRLTRENEKIIEVTLDNGEKIKCTLDHLFMLRDGSYKKAIELKKGNSLMPLYTKLYDSEDENLKGYEMVYQPIGGNWEFIHRLSDEYNLRNGIYQKNAGRIRHHKDFNKLNNNPNNILRIQWQDHWKFHKIIASERHKNDPEYVRKLAEGRRKFIENNRHVFTIRAINLNKKLWTNPDFRKRHSERIKKMWQDPKYKEYMRKASSKNLKSLWKRKDFQELLSKLKSEEMKKRWQDEKYRAYWSKKMKEISLKIWSSPSHREYISKLMKEKSQDPRWRERQSKIAKALWQNPEYRAKYQKDYFQKIGKKPWLNPEFRKRQTEKAIKQWQNSEFRKKALKVVRKGHREFLKRNPDWMKKLTEKAKISLHKNWKNPQYKEKVVKSRILSYVYSLLNEHPKVTPEIYERERYNNCIPKIKNALNYFDNFSEILAESQKRNHKVIKTRVLRERKDVYDLTTEPWHNFALAAGIFVHNSIDSDPPAAQRYTECKLSEIGEEMLRDIEKNTVNFTDNYDGTRKEPMVLPSPLPQLLLNGSLGIAVGMATNIPPHNLGEVIDAAIYLLDHSKADTEDLFQFIKGPDFPTGGQIYGKKEIIEAYSQGKGGILTRGKVEILEGETGKTQILITEIPFQAQKSSLIEQLAKLVQEKKIQGIRDIRDESDKEGLRIVIDLSREAYPQKVLNQLYKFTDLQRTFHLNMLALVDGIQPRVLSLVDLLNSYLSFRKEVVFRRTKYDLKKAEEKAHILLGLNKCLGKIDQVIKLIKTSKDREEAEKRLMKRFKLTKIQANAILETKLSALAKLERKKIEEELKENLEKIKIFKAISKSPQKIKEITKKELKEIKEKFGDERKTKVFTQRVGEIAVEDLIPQEETIITLTQAGYIKRINPKIYKIQKRGGKGMVGMQTLQDDIVEHFLSANTHDALLFFTDSGKVFKIVVYEIPEATRVARGRGLLNFLEISPQEKVLTLFPLSKEDLKLGIKYLVMSTKNGIIKKTEISDFENVRRSGLIAISLKRGDLLKAVQKSSGEDEVILVTQKGQAIRFKEKDIRPMGRQASGIKGMRLKRDDRVVGMDIISNFKFQISNFKQKEKTKQYLLVVTENGYGKRTDLAEYRLQKRGGSGIKTAKITSKTGDLVFSKLITDEEDLIIISRKGKVIRTKISQIPKLSRATQGVKIMRLEEDKVASATCI